MRGYEIENELMHLKVSEWLCCTKVFTIKGKEASKYDFGEQDDFDNGYNNDGEGYDDEPGGCHCMTFTAKEPTKEVLDKYGITVEEYNQIAAELERGLSFGYCGLCR